MIPPEESSPERNDGRRCNLEQECGFGKPRYGRFGNLRYFASGSRASRLHRGSDLCGGIDAVPHEPPTSPSRSTMKRHPRHVLPTLIGTCAEVPHPSIADHPPHLLAADFPELPHHEWLKNDQFMNELVCLGKCSDSGINLQNFAQRGHFPCPEISRRTLQCMRSLP